LSISAAPKEDRHVMAQQLLQISDSARSAFAGLTIPEDTPQGIRVYFQGFG